MKLLLLGFLLLVSYTHAFCIYNDMVTDTIWVRQMPGHTGGTYSSRFRHESINPGEKECCHFTSYDCNTSRDPETILELAFQTSFNGVERDLMSIVTLPAGGWVELRATSTNTPEVVVFTAAGDRYAHELRYNPQGVLLSK